MEGEGYRSGRHGVESVSMFTKTQKNVKKVEDKEHEEVLARCIPVAQEILKVIVDKNLGMGDITGTRPPEYLEAALAVQRILLEHDVRWGEKEFVFMLARQPLEMLSKIVMDDFQKTFEAGTCKLYGVESFNDLTMGVIDGKLKGHASTP